MLRNIALVLLALGKIRKMPSMEVPTC